MSGLSSAGVSVLMPVHAAVSPSHLKAALTSILAQTRPADQIVVVADGPLGAELDAVLAALPALERINLPSSRGAGPALQAGLMACRQTWVARADADDINAPERLERQIQRLSDQDADVCSAAMLEFLTGHGDEPSRILGVRGCPEDHAGFARRMRLLNPVNHPTAVFRRELAVQAGGYQQLPLLEDYDLWARMLAGGARFTGVEQPLVRFRADGMLARRTSRDAAAYERELQQRLVAYGLISTPRAFLNILIRGLFRRLPGSALRVVYHLAFRRRGHDQR